MAKHENAALTNMVEFNHDAFETLVELQLSMLSGATRLCEETLRFMTAQFDAGSTTWREIATASVSGDVVRAQLDLFNRLVTTYQAEADRIVELGCDSAHETAEAMRSVFPRDDA